jgi:hypothetical protein
VVEVADEVRGSVDVCYQRQMARRVAANRSEAGRSWRRWLAVWAALVTFAAVPASLLLLLQPPAQAPSWAPLRAEAAGRVQALDAHVLRWNERTVSLAGEVAALLRQLPAGEIGSAAEGTLMLHLQRRLSAAKELGELAVLSPKGKVLLSTDGTRVGQPAGQAFPEVAQAASSPSAALVTSAGESQLVLGAPISSGGELKGIMFARLKPATSRDLLRPSLPGLKVDVVDASGQALSGQGGADLLEIGSASRPGQRLRAGGRLVAYAPLRQIRAVVAVSGPALEATGPLGRWHAAVGALIVLLAGVCAWLLARRRGQRTVSSGR